MTIFAPQSLLYPRCDWCWRLENLEWISYPPHPVYDQPIEEVLKEMVVEVEPICWNSQFFGCLLYSAIGVGGGGGGGHCGQIAE